jgi:hypothetical protein
MIPRRLSHLSPFIDVNRTESAYNKLHANRLEDSSRLRRTGRLFGAFAAALVMAALAWAGHNPWDEKPYAEWTLVDVLKVTRDSPWARPLGDYSTQSPAESAARRTALDADPTGRSMKSSLGKQVWIPPQPNVRPPKIPPSDLPANSQQSLADTVVLWSSSATIRQAFARQAALERKSTEEQEKRLEASPTGTYKITVTGSHLPAILASYKDPPGEALKNSVYLKTNHSQQVIHPAKFEIAMQPPQPMVNFYFTRAKDGAPILRPEDEKVRFAWKSKEAEIQVTFDLRKMQRNGTPDF